VTLTLALALTLTGGQMPLGMIAPIPRAHRCFTVVQEVDEDDDAETGQLQRAQSTLRRRRHAKTALIGIAIPLARCMSP
jgi:hypothetical protein